MKINATVKSINPDARVGKYPVTAFEVETDKGLKTYNLFKNDPLNDKVLRLRPGQSISLTIEKNNKGYWNPTAFEETNAPQSARNANQSFDMGADRNKSDDIRRAVALKAAVDLTAATLGKKELDPAYVIGLATAFLPFLAGEAAVEPSVPETGEDDPF